MTAESMSGQRWLDPEDPTIKRILALLERERVLDIAEPATVVALDEANEDADRLAESLRLLQSAGLTSPGDDRALRDHDARVDPVT